MKTRAVLVISQVMLAVKIRSYKAYDIARLLELKAATMFDRMRGYLLVAPSICEL